MLQKRSFVKFIQIIPSFLQDFPPGKHFIKFSANNMQDFRNFVLHNCIVVFDAEKV